MVAYKCILKLAAYLAERAIENPEDIENNERYFDIMQILIIVLQFKPEEIEQIVVSTKNSKIWKKIKRASENKKNVLHEGKYYSLVSFKESEGSGYIHYVKL